jgi:ADP-ribose pyrophosphatase YjhB (NUDIX family)
MSEKFKYIGSAYLILLKEGKILLQRRANTGFMDGYYGLPAGHLDGNETSKEGCSREMKEEIGIDIEPINLKVVHVMHRKSEKDERIDFFMTGDKYTGEISNCELDKCDDLSWFPVDDQKIRFRM